MKEYDPKILRKLQLKELEILKDFDALCRKHDIPYLMFYGSGIGALRHGGFIPWDDDIDVLMLREDFERFLRIAKEEYNDRYHLLTPEENFDCPQMNAHWGPKNTNIIPHEFKDSTCKFTISLDLFPLDNISDDESAKRKQWFTAWFWNKLMILRRVPRPVLHFDGLKEKIIYFMCGVIHMGLKTLHISPKWLYKNCRKACLQFDDRKTERVAFLTGTVPGECSFTRAELFPPRYLDFEGMKYPFPNQLETLLTRQYGDYMQLPPVEQRRNHLPYLLDFGDGEVYVGEE